MTYTIRDGGLGDDDLSVNGVIRDPGGPVIGDNGDVQGIPTLSQWTLVLLRACLIS